MPIYKYTALSADGQGVEGESLVQSADELRFQLEAQNLLVSHISLKWWTPRSWRLRPLELQELTLFVQELVVLLRAGLNLTEVLSVLTRRNSEVILTGVLIKVREAIASGQSPSQAFAQSGKLFDRLFIAALKTGEKTGDLIEPLSAYHRQLVQGLKVQKNVKQAMMYPAFLLLTLAVVMVLLFTYVLPRFSAIYTDLGTQLPAATQGLVHISQLLPYIVAVLMLSIMAGAIWLRNPDRYLQARKRLRISLQRLPLLGGLLKQLYAYQFISALSMLLKSGTPLLSAMKLIHDDYAETPLHTDIGNMIETVRQGQSLAQAMISLNYFHDSAMKLIEVGEEVGSLGEMLNEAAMYYEEKIDTDVSRISSMIEPMLVLLMGLLVGGTIIVMYLPIFYMSSVV